MALFLDKMRVFQEEIANNPQQGFIMSDWDAQHSGVASTFAGLDMTMPVSFTLTFVLGITANNDIG